MKNIRILYLKLSVFGGENCQYIWIGVFLMYVRIATVFLMLIFERNYFSNSPTAKAIAPNSLSHAERNEN